MREYDFHDNSLMSFTICRTPDSLSVRLDMTDYASKASLVAVFANVDWISANLIGLVASENTVDYVRELPWSDVPSFYAVNPHNHKHYIIGLTGGSSIRIVSLEMTLGENRGHSNFT